MKKIIAALILIGMLAACTQRTCPTYTKDSLKKMEQTEKDA